MNVIVFGGSGFLGSHVADALTESGYSVTIFDNKESPYLNLKQKIIIGDITNTKQVLAAAQGHEIVYNFAAIADLDEACKNPLETIKVNVLGNTNVLEACVKNNIKRFVFASTVYVYSVLAPFYRSSKQACELIIDDYYVKYGLEYTILRYGSLYGARANRFNFIHQIIRQALTERKISRKGDGEEIRDYINVLDAARCSLKILDTEYKNQHIMITGTQTIKIRDLLEMIKEMLGNNIEVEYLPGKNTDHYEITPYSFKPQVAKKVILDNYHDLGQGMLSCIYDVYAELEKNTKNLPEIKNQLY